jgi:signal transduction histidine kinase
MNWTLRRVNLLWCLATAGLGAVMGAAVRQARQRARRGEELWASAQAESRAAVQMRDQVMASAFHDLKTPLAATRLMAHLIHRDAKQGSLDPKQTQERVELIEANVAKMSSIIAELMDLARLQAGRSIQLQLAETDLVALARKVAHEADPTAAGRRIRVETDVPRLAGDWDGPRLERVLTNLVGNALRYSPHGGEIVVRVAQERRGGRDFAIVSVSDEGIGIPREDLPHVFDWFHRAANAAGIPGSGVGLASAKVIVEKHGGTIDVRSQVGRGTTVTVQLPARPLSQREALRPEESTRAAAERSSPGP